MIQIYRIEEKEGEEPEILHKEVCYDCAEEKKNEGHQITFDLALARDASITKDSDYCEICGGTFWLDGRKKHPNLKSTHDSIC